MRTSPRSKRAPAEKLDTSSRVRVTIDLNEEDYESLTRMAETKSESRATVMRAAIKLYSFISECVREDRSIFVQSKEGNGSLERVLPLV